MDYASGTGTNYVQKWIGKNLSKKEAANVEALLDILSKKKEWSEPDYKPLQGSKYKEFALGEIRLKGDQKIPIRLIGFLDTGAKQFVILMVCRHKDNVYTPPECLDTAHTRYKQLARGVGIIEEHFTDEDEEAV